MTFTQFKKMKPQYKVRIIVVFALFALLIVGIIFGLSAGYQALMKQMRTTKMETLAASTVLKKEGFQKILEIIGTSNANQVLVLDSQIITTEKGQPTSVVMNLVSIGENNVTDLWQLRAEGMKVEMERFVRDNENRSALAQRKITLADYYPAVSRLSSMEMVAYLQQNVPVGEGGNYRFLDDFESNLFPDFSSKLPVNTQALWLSKTGAVSTVNKEFTPVSVCAPLEVYATAVDAERSSKKKLVFQDEQKITVVLCEAGPYIT